MAEYTKLTVKECAERILEIENPLILMHARPDGDTVGAGIALCEIFKALGKNPVYLSEDNIPKRLEFLTQGNKFASSYENKDVVAVDIASPKQAGAVLSKLPAPTLMIDHHEVGIPFADFYTVPGLSSAGEAVLNVALELEKMGKISLTQKIAYPIYAAISSDTACFRYSSANDLTYEKAALLINTGIDFSDINHKLFNCKLPEQVKAEGFVSSKIKTAFSGKVAYAEISLAERKALCLDFEFFETAVDVVRSLFGVEIAFVVKETDTGEFRASLRSIGANVAKIAAELDGGGHVRAAGCSPKAASAEEASSIILDLIEKENIFKGAKK
ncbi:MAG: DHH family phosphoesterase [Clostridia bacterium]|nr:DHH family phosphoesterase [Clostridia bacterium]